MNSDEPNEILALTVDVVENLSTLSQLDLSRSRHEQKVSMLEGDFCGEKVEINASNNRTRETMTEMAKDTKTRSELFTSHLKGLSARAKALKLV